MCGGCVCWSWGLVVLCVFFEWRGDCLVVGIEVVGKGLGGCDSGSGIEDFRC